MQTWLRAMTPQRAGLGALLATPGALGLYLGFSSGGFFPGPSAVAAAGLLFALALRTSVAARPFEGLGWTVGVAAGALALLAAWTLASASWSDAPARALLEYDRTLLYLAAILLLGSVGWTAGRLRLALYGVLAAIVAVCAVAFVTRVLPDTFPADPGIAPERLEYPLGYWNALGLVSGFGIVGCAHLAASAGERAVVRVAGAMALPLLVSTLLLTFSRGAIAVSIAGLLLYACLVRERLLLTATAASAVPVAAAAVATYRADLLGSDRPTSAAAVEQGADLAVVVLAATLAAGALRWLLLRADRRLMLVPPGRWRTPARLIAASGVTLAVAAFLVAGGPGELSRQYDNFVEGDRIPVDTQRERLTQVGNDGRLDQWEVALDAAAEEPLHGTGAGTFATLWRQERDRPVVRHDAHSLYVETVAELGLVGLGLLLTAIVALLLGVARRVRSTDRALFAVVLSLGAMWALHAGLDWDWEMPALGIPVLALCALAVARAPTGAEAPAGGVGRIVPALIALALSVTPVSVALSQHRLDESVRAFLAGDCRRSVSRAIDAAAVLPVRAEPFQVMGFCDARSGQYELAARVMRNAVRLDPDNWEFHYSLAIVLAAGGRDPRPDLRAARALDPESALLDEAWRRFRGDDPKVWQRRARGAPLPFQR